MNHLPQDLAHITSCPDCQCRAALAAPDVDLEWVWARVAEQLEPRNQPMPARTNALPHAATPSQRPPFAWPTINRPIRAKPLNGKHDLYMPSPIRGSFRHRTVLALAAAAVILAMIGGVTGAMVAHRLWFGRGDSGLQAGAPAISAPVLASPAASTTVPVLTITIPAELVPKTHHRVTGFSYDKYLAGSQSVWNPYCCDGTVIQYQLTGSLQITADAAIQIVRANGAVDIIQAGIETTVNSGDALVTSNQTRITTVNSGTVDAEVLNWLLIDDPGNKFGGRGGQDGLTGMNHDEAGDFQQSLIELPGAVRITFWWFDLGPDQKIPVPSAGTWLAISQGLLKGTVLVAQDESYIMATNTTGSPTTTVYLVTLEPVEMSEPSPASSP